MQSQYDLPVLIFAQSGRFLAQSATQAGYRVWVADCFGDDDLHESAERWLLLPPIPTLTPSKIIHLLTTLSQGEKCQLICGSGIESTYSFLEQLPDYIQLMGNTAKVIHQLKTPSLFFPLLDKLALTYPKTLLKLDKKISDYLVKSSSGMGGVHIQHLDNVTDIILGTYFQQFISGDSGSILFLANGSSTKRISINKLAHSANALYPFQLGSIRSPWLVNEKHLSTLNNAIAAITKATRLIGLNSLDFIISDNNELFLLEVNPRVSSSAELIDNPGVLLEYHMNACQGRLPKSIVTSPPASSKVIYAPHDVVIPEDIDWPINCSDLSSKGSLVRQNAPICTSVIHESKSHAAPEYSHYETEEFVLKQL